MSFCAKLFRRKPITKDVAADSKLIRVLGLLDIIGFGCASAGIVFTFFDDINDKILYYILIIKNSWKWCICYKW